MALGGTPAITASTAGRNYLTQRGDAPAGTCAFDVGFRPRENPGNVIHFALFLPPASSWDQGDEATPARRFLAVGNGGFSGAIAYEDMYVRAKRGYATMSTDTGHQGDLGGMATTAIQRDWAVRAMQYSVPMAKAVVQNFYGLDITGSYYAGCSTGGRQGLRQIEADRRASTASSSGRRRGIRSG
jgi:hypothetical protein